MVNKKQKYYRIVKSDGTPVRVGTGKIHALMQATSPKEAVESFKELHPRVKGRLRATRKLG